MDKDNDKKEENWIEDLNKNKDFKKKFIGALQKLGFPLEFKIRKRLSDKEYKNVQEGYFSENIDGNEITKSFDISAYKSKSKKVINEITVHIDLQIIGDCKSTIDIKKFLFAIPESGNIRNKLFVGPILTNLQSANYGVFRNMEVASQFIAKYGTVYLASDLKDTSKDMIMSDNENKKDTTLEYERIFNVCENTILPALKSKFIFWRNAAITDYNRIFSNNPTLRGTTYPVDFLKKEFFAFRLLIPIIITTKPILIPELKDGNIVNIKPIGFVLYEHSVLNPNKYIELLHNAYDIGIFVCNEKHFDKLIEYIENLSEKLFEEITNNLNRHPNRFFEDFQETNKFNKEIGGRKKL